MGRKAVDESCSFWSEFQRDLHAIFLRQNTKCSSRFCYSTSFFLIPQERADIKRMFEDDAEELEQFIASDSESEAKSTGSEPSNSDSDEEVIVKKRKVTTRKTREETKEDLSKGIVF